MAETPTRTLYDGYINTLGGVNSALLPRQINPNQVAWAENVVMRGGYPQTRPAFKYLGSLNSGKFQGACYYVNGHDEHISTCFDGHVYLHKLKSSGIETVDITPPNDANNSKMTTAWGLQAESWLVWQNGLNRPYVYNGGPTARRANDDEISTGTWMTYGNGRIFVANGELLYAGNIVGNEGPIKFTEANYFLGGIPFGFGSEITGLGVLPSLSSETGQGELIVTTRDATFTFQSQIFDRSLWTTNAMQRLLFPSIGLTAGGTLIPVNQDLYGRWSDGWRSIRRTVMDSQSEGFIPLSEEIRRITDFESERHTSYASAIYFKNRLLMTCSPYISNGMVVFNGVVSLDFTPLSLGIGMQAQPAYDGVWTGLKFVKLLKGSFRGNERAFAIAQFNTNDYYLFEITDNQTYDGNADNVNDIQSSIESRGFSFNGDGFSLKRLKHAELYVSKIRGEVDISVKYRPEDDCQWYDWADLTVNSATEFCPDSCETDPPNYKPQYRRKLRIGHPADGNCNEHTNSPAHLMIDGQVKVAWTGHMGLNRIRLEAQLEGSQELAECTNETEARVIDCPCYASEYEISITNE